MATTAPQPGMWDDGGALPPEDQTYGGGDQGADAGKVDQQTAGYMELDGAQKSGDCDLVQVDGGVSGEKGCCNLYSPVEGASEFECAQCTHFTGGQGGEQQPEAGPEQSGGEPPAGNSWAGAPQGQGGQWS